MCVWRAAAREDTWAPDAAAPRSTLAQRRYTALITAIKFKAPGVAKLLVEKKANVNAAAVNGATAIFVAAQVNDPGSAKLLVDNQANVHATMQVRPAPHTPFAHARAVAREAWRTFGSDACCTPRAFTGRRYAAHPRGAK